ncbi:MAG: YkgJ family cysteine cluster protein [Bdellovibrionales bacterium]|nr:YkgJ family cysteine cluster protein [Bdellovibrionales bacterium]
MDSHLEPSVSFVHPCLTCGACCASFRVAFYWREAEATDHIPTVPQGQWEELTETQRCMKGTSSKHNPKCTALQGRIGTHVSCSIYENRPTPCRKFMASFEDGTRNERCDQAREKHGLPPLNKRHWRGR